MNVLVTGGASGLGKSIATVLAKEKYTVYFTYNNSKEEATLLENTFSNVHGIKCNFLSENDLSLLLETIEDKNIDVLVNNALMGFETKHFHKIDPAYFAINFQKNIIPVVKIVQRFIKSSRKKKFGKIINILSSTVINTPPSGWSEYVASKAYLKSLSNSWAVENIKFNITSNCISPDFMNTKLHHNMDDRVLNSLIERHPLKELLKTEEVAEIVLFYVKSSQQINGTNFLVNTGTNIA